ncbi:MAG: hypothetical protein ACK51L_03955 [bacterium]
MTRAELDARKAAPAYAEGANPLMYLAEIFNNYDEFKPQNLMVKYASSGVNQPPVKVTPYQPSTSEWAYLATFTNDLEPTNLLLRNIIRDEDWIKSRWTDCHKYLHQMFTNYNRSGQHDDDKDEWGSEKELRRWSRAAKWNPGNAGSIIRFPSAMISSAPFCNVIFWSSSYDTLFDRQQQTSQKCVFCPSYDTWYGRAPPKYSRTPILTYTCENSYDSTLTSTFPVYFVTSYKTFTIRLQNKL